MMQSENYGAQLIEQAKRIDKLSEKNHHFEKLALSITNKNSENAPLLLIKDLFLLKEKIENFKNEQNTIVELLYLYLGSYEIDCLYQKLLDNNSVSFDVLKHNLDELIGLNEVKNQINDLVIFNKIQKIREQKGLKKTKKTLHMAFLGNPGTAKTTVARIVGNMYKSLGLISKGHFIEASRTDLIAEYQGQTAIKVKKLIERAKGGVLFIDEAYSITENDKSDSYGKECITELTKALEDYRDDLVVIVAGYPDLMNNFFNSNPGLKSRFNTFINFEDFTIDELIDIFCYQCKKFDYKIDPLLLEKLKEKINKNIHDNKVESQSNGRYIRNIFDNVVMNQSKRLGKKNIDPSREELMLLMSDDLVV